MLPVRAHRMPRNAGDFGCRCRDHRHRSALVGEIHPAGSSVDLSINPAPGPHRTTSSVLDFAHRA